MNVSIPITLSVALVTRNRPEELRRCLASWRSQQVTPDEIIVSDDSNEVHREEIACIAREFGGKYTKGPGRGLYANRNWASLACSGSHIMSADDDHTHPPDFTKDVLQVVQSAPERIWTFGEKHPDRPGTSIAPPGELHVSGCGCAPTDSNASAAISDGASVYPRAVFDKGFRYDESYQFGGMWYLWGKVLQRAGWQISFSDKTFVWHHFSPIERAHDKNYLKAQLCCNTYASLVYSKYIQRSLVATLVSLLYLARRMVLTDSAPGYDVRVRITPQAALEMLHKVRKAKMIYGSQLA